MKTTCLSQSQLKADNEKTAKKMIRSEKMKRRNWIWLIIFGAIAIMCFGWKLFATYSPTETNLGNVLLPPGKEHIFGTDSLGRDVFSRTLFGGMVSITVSALVTFFAIIIGIVYGGISGYKGGMLDTVMMRFVDVMYSIPSTIIVLVFQMVFPNKILGLIIIMSLTNWMTTARVVRARFQELKESNFIILAKGQNIPKRKIIFGHMTRNTLSSIVVIATFTFANAIITETALSFLGVGIPSDIPSWGNMINNAQSYVLSNKWWVCFFPGMLIILSSLSINFGGEYLKNKYTSVGFDEATKGDGKPKRGVRRWLRV